MRTLSPSPGFDSLLTLSEHPNSSEFLITPGLQRTLTLAEVRLGRPETQLQGPQADQGPRNFKLDRQFDFGNLAPHVLVNSSTGTTRLDWQYSQSTDVEPYPPLPSAGPPTCFPSQRLLQPHALDLRSPLPLLHLCQLPLDGLQRQGHMSHGAS